MTVRLQPWLRRFQRELELFPEHWSAELGPMVQRMAAALGSLAPAHFDGFEPEGFDGVELRGNYHRLLATEWLLSEEAPDEFLRRAAMNEHLFLRLGRREPRAGRRLVALFDVGPMQLGSPRLAQLATLLALHERSRKGSAAFAFGVLQQPWVLGTELSEAALRSFMTARSTKLVDVEVLLRALQLQNAPQPGDEVWVVGAQSAARALADERFADVSRCCVQIVDDLIEEGDQLTITVDAARRRTLSLPLPEPQVCSQLWRAPFDRPATTSAPEGANLWFSLSAKEVLVQRADDVACYGAGAHLILRDRLSTARAQEQVVAVNRLRRGFVSIVERRARYVLDGLDEEVRLEFVERPVRPPRLGQPLWNLIVAGKGKRQVIIVRDSAGTIFRGRRTEQAATMTPLALDCLGLFWRRGHLELVASRETFVPGQHMVEVVEFARFGMESPVQAPERLTAEGPLHVLPACAPGGVVGVQVPDDQDELPAGFQSYVLLGSGAQLGSSAERISKPKTLLLPQAHRAVALVGIGGEWHIVSLSGDRKKLHVSFDGEYRLMGQFTEPAESWTVASTRPRVAFRCGHRVHMVDFQQSPFMWSAEVAEMKR